MCYTSGDMLQFLKTNVSFLFVDFNGKKADYRGGIFKLYTRRRTEKIETFPFYYF